MSLEEIYANTHSVIVFSPDTACVQCTATYRMLDRKKIDYKVVTVPDDDKETREQIKALGFMRFPVVWAKGTGYWSGFNPEKIEEIAAVTA